MNTLVIQNNISNLRAVLDLSFAKFGNLFENSSASAALKWESGETTPSKSKIKLFADFCGVSVEDFTSKVLSERELEVIKSLYHYGDTIVYLGSEAIKKVNIQDNVINFSSDIYFGFNHGNVRNAFDMRIFFSYDPAYSSTIVINLEPLFNSLNEKFLLDFDRLLGRYIYVSNRKHFEKILFDSISALYNSLTSAIKQEIQYISMPVYEDNKMSYEDYHIAYQQWKEASNTEIESNLLLFTMEYQDYEKSTFFWPQSFFNKNGKALFTDYLELKYN